MAVLRQKKLFLFVLGLVFLVEEQTVFKLFPFKSATDCPYHMCIFVMQCLHVVPSFLPHPKSLSMWRGTLMQHSMVLVRRVGQVFGHMFF